MMHEVPTMHGAKDLSMGNGGTVEETKSISVIGQGVVVGKPDICFVYLYAEGKGKTLQGATDECDHIVEEIREAVHAEIDEPHMRTLSHFSGEKARGLGSRTDLPTMKLHVKKVLFTLPADPELARRAVDISLRSGAVVTPSVDVEWMRQAHSTILYSCNDYEALHQEALRQAIENARDRANAIAQTVGKRPGDVATFTMAYSMDDMNVGRHSTDNALPVPWSRVTGSSEELKVTAKARVGFEILDPNQH